MYHNHNPYCPHPEHDKFENYKKYLQNILSHEIKERDKKTKEELKEIISNIETKFLKEKESNEKNFTSIKTILNNMDKKNSLANAKLNSKIDKVSNDMNTGSGIPKIAPEEVVKLFQEKIKTKNKD